MFFLLYWVLNQGIHDLMKVELASGALVIVAVHLSREVIYSFYQISKRIYDPQAVMNGCTTQSCSRSVYDHKAFVGGVSILQLIFFYF